MRIRLTAFTAVAIVLAVVAASPASAATGVTSARLEKSLLSANDLGPGWHRFRDSSSEESTASGCAAFDYKSVGVRREGSQNYQFEQLPFFVTETVESFGTSTQAETDFTTGVDLFAECATFTSEGTVWKVTRMRVARFADQRAMFRVSGTIDGAAGAVKVDQFLVVTRHGRQLVVVLLAVGGNDITAATRRELAGQLVGLSRGATAKVARVLGR